MPNRPEHYSVLAPTAAGITRCRRPRAVAGALALPEGRLFLLFVAAGLVGAAAGRAAASTFTVNNTLDDGSAGSLRWAVNQANTHPGDDTIKFSNGVFHAQRTIALAGTQLELTDTTGTTTIDGPASGVTVDAGGQSRVLEIDASVAASISGMTLRGGAVGNNEQGGGLLNQGTLALANCSVRDNSGTDIVFGGGFANLGTAALRGCTVSGNSALEGAGVVNSGVLSATNCTISGNSNPRVQFGGVGGGLINFRTGTATLTHCTISDNFGNDAAGGAWCIGTTTLTDCEIRNNSTGYGPGGGVLIDHSGSATLAHCRINNNFAGGWLNFDNVDGGGGVAVSGCACTLTECTISGNHAVTQGGGVSISGNSSQGPSTLDHCTIRENSTDGQSFFGAKGGGGVALSFAAATLERCAIRDNSATGADGGGGVACSAGDATLVHCTVSGNTADKGGGVACALFNYYDYYLTPGSVTLTDCDVSGNTANDVGGGVSNDVQCTLDISGGHIGRNSADSGGGIFSEGDSLTVDCCNIHHNNAAARGGGIETSGGTATISRSHINNNRITSAATAQGGGIGSENTDVLLSHCDVNANRANGMAAQGGGIFALAGSLSADGCDINGNRASGTALGQGGGIYFTGGVMTVPSNSVHGNHASTAFDNIFYSP